MADVCSISVPVEALSQTFRQTQKKVTKALQGVGGGVAAAAEAGESPAAFRARLRGMIAELEALQQDAARGGAAEQRQIARAQARASFTASGPAGPTDWAWHGRLLNVALTEYLLKSGDHEAAQSLAEEAGLAGFLDAEVYATIESVELALRSGDCTKALQWCSDNASRLRRLNSPLVFQLTLQEFVELVRAGDPAAALSFAREKLSAFATEPEYSHDYQVAMATIALSDPETSTIPEYAALFGAGRWDELARLFQREVRRAYGMSVKGLLDVTVQAGLCALKTRACVCAAPDASNGNGNGVGVGVGDNGGDGGAG
eukprot:CAMPEP_0118860392 /NCGR_PEP_ID=MMETSP1163-20130328/6258_1 /TAXON_ID=124430 /ORGANISM="Phaeomonas parva, Strain CCMP2877" /LENGTH=315 /DNA_ID=CAMNT_0006794077 /DNA_START=260 /DNA_END=1203 /DNA_ORIENTATION=+